MYKILDYIDLQLESYFAKNNKYPDFIIMNEEIKTQFIKQYKESLNLDSLDCIIADKEDNYKGIQIKIEKEEGMKLI